MPILDRRHLPPHPISQTKLRTSPSRTVSGPPGAEILLPNYGASLDRRRNCRCTADLSGSARQDRDRLVFTVFLFKIALHKSRLTLSFPDGYPDGHQLIVSVVADDIVPVGLKRKLEGDLNQIATDNKDEGYAQIKHIFQHLTTFINENMFVPCWRELKQCVSLVKTSNENASSTKQSTISIYERQGKIRLGIVASKYHYNCSITVDPAYPDFSPANNGKACLLKVIATNFSEPIEKILTSQAQEIVRKMQEGLSSEKAVLLSNPIKVPKNFHLGAGVEKDRVISNSTILDIKHDTEALKRVNDLRKKEATSVRASGDNGYVNTKQLARDRKDARRAIHKLTLEERKHDEDLESKERQWQLEEKKRLEGYYDSHIDQGGTIDPQPSLLVLISFLVQKIKGLVDEKCPACKKPVLPANPDDLALMYGKHDSVRKRSKECKRRRPMRVYCGHWYHRDCLTTTMTEPPFGLSCPAPGCGKRIYHPDFSGDIQTLEREWAAKQARLREVEDAMNFL